MCNLPKFHNNWDNSIYDLEEISNDNVTTTDSVTTIYFANSLVKVSLLCGCSTTRLRLPIKGFGGSVSKICLVPGVL